MFTTLKKNIFRKLKNISEPNQNFHHPITFPIREFISINNNSKTFPIKNPNENGHHTHTHIHIRMHHPQENSNSHFSTVITARMSRALFPNRTRFHLRSLSYFSRRKKKCPVIKIVAAVMRTISRGINTRDPRWNMAVALYGFMYARCGKVPAPK